MSLASEMRCAANPGELMRRVGREPDDWQQEYLLSDRPRIQLCASRQTGKSEATAAKALHRAMYRERSLVLAIGAAQRQALELMQKARELYAASPSVPLVGRPAELRLRFENGSRIVALRAKEATVRSFSGVGLLILDEDARVPDVMYAAVRPMLRVSKGDLVLLSSPFGKRGHFWQTWQAGLPPGWEEMFKQFHAPVVETGRDGMPRYRSRLAAADRGRGWRLFLDHLSQLGAVHPRWQRFLVMGDDVPRLDDAFLQEELETLGDWWWLQEYFCMFHSPIDAAFNYDLVVAALAQGGDAFNFRPADVDAVVEVAARTTAKPFFGGDQ